MAGILRESCEPDNCGADGTQFSSSLLTHSLTHIHLTDYSHAEGIYSRYLGYLVASNALLPLDQTKFANFLTKNANWVWGNNRNSEQVRSMQVIYKHCTSIIMYLYMYRLVISLGWCGRARIHSHSTLRYRWCLYWTCSMLPI